jgi:hypothetical protein
LQEVKRGAVVLAEREGRLEEERAGLARLRVRLADERESLKKQVMRHNEQFKVQKKQQAAVFGTPVFCPRNKFLTCLVSLQD